MTCKVNVVIGLWNVKVISRCFIADRRKNEFEVEPVSLNAYSWNEETRLLLSGRDNMTMPRDVVSSFRQCRMILTQIVRSWWVFQPYTSFEAGSNGCVVRQATWQYTTPIETSQDEEVVFI